MVVVHPTVNTFSKQMHMQIMPSLNSRFTTNCVKLHFFEMLNVNVVSPFVPTHT